MGQREDELLDYLIDYLMRERMEHINGMEAPILVRTEGDTPWHLFRALVNTRQPIEAQKAFYEAQDEMLRALIADAGISTVDDARHAPADSRVGLWRGDITTLAVDAIVNAANSRMLGCWAPNHICIDNAIHTFAGVQLREECARLMAGKDRPVEPTGTAEVTAAYNLPSAHVIHTVGPIVQGEPTEGQSEQLASCYTSCLDAAVGCGCTSIAFPCISTGEFGYPHDEAARTAVNAVRAWLDAHPDTGIFVVFDVFGDDDDRIYRDLLGL